MTLSIVIFAVIVVGFMAFVRLSTSNPATWHIDPETFAGPRKKNSFRSVVFYDPRSADEIMHAVNDTALADGATLFGGSLDAHWVTYESRSTLFRYPDYTSFKVAPDEDGMAIYVYSRARFGYSDFGANKRRVYRWLRLSQSEDTQSQ